MGVKRYAIENISRENIVNTEFSRTMAEEVQIKSPYKDLDGIFKVTLKPGE
jgi:hypothetical protein